MTVFIAQYYSSRLNLEKLKEKLVIREATYKDVYRIYIFFLLLDRDPHARKFYRYMQCYTLKDKIFTLMSLLINLGLRRITQALLKRYYIAIICLLGGHVVGICHISLNLRKREGVYGIAILRCCRGHGLGYRVSLLSITLAKKWGIRKINLSVDVDNYKAIRLYKKLGFNIVKKVIKGDYRPQTREYVDYYVMVKYI